MRTAVIVTALLMLHAHSGASSAHATCAGERASIDLGRLPLFETKPAHPLAGQVYDARASTLLDPCPERALASLAVALRVQIALAEPWKDGPTLIVMGEVHDNPSVHALRAALIREIAGPAGATLRLPLVLEHVRTDRQVVLDGVNAAVAAGTPPTPDSVFESLEWPQSGWPDQKMFEPLLSVALAAKLALFAGDVPRASMSAVARQGLDALSADNRALLRLDKPLAPALENDLLVELEASHCGLMPKQSFTNMAVAQRLRDATLAASLLAAASTYGGAAILLAGNGHARNDRGVPSLFGDGRRSAKVVSVMLLEVEDSNDDPAAYVPKDPDGKPAVDIVVFVPRIGREDPCIAMRQQFARPPQKP